MRSFLTCFLAGLSVTVGLAGAPFSAAAAAEEVSPSVYAAQVHRTVNEARAARDRTRLAVDRCMVRFAERAAVRMAASDDVNDTGSVRPAYRQCDLHAVVQQSAIGRADGRKTVNQVYLRYARDLVLDRRWRLQASAARQSESGTWYVMVIVAERT